MADWTLTRGHEWTTKRRWVGTVPVETTYYQGQVDSISLYGYDGSVRIDVKDLEKLYNYLGLLFSKDDEGVV